MRILYDAGTAFLGIQAAGAAGGAYGDNIAIKAETSYQRTVLKMNERYAGKLATEEYRLGQKEGLGALAEGIRAQGQQRAGLAAQGIDITKGSADQAQADVFSLTAMEQAQIQENAAKRVLGLQMQQNELHTEAELAKIAGRNRRRGSLVTAGMKIGNAMAQYGYERELEAQRREVPVKKGSGRVPYTKYEVTRGGLAASRSAISTLKGMRY